MLFKVEFTPSVIIDPFLKSLKSQGKSGLISLHGGKLGRQGEYCPGEDVSHVVRVGNVVIAGNVVRVGNVVRIRRWEMLVNSRADLGWSWVQTSNL